MKENVFEDIISKYPELIEEDLKFVGRQLNVKGKFVDLLFVDKYGQNLIIELKVGPIVRKHIGQIMDYEGYFISPDDPTVRVMLIGNRVPKNLQRSLDHHGIEWKEIPEFHLVAFLKSKGDNDLLRLISEESIEVNSISTESASQNDMPKKNKLTKKTEGNEAFVTETRIGRKVERGSGSVIDVIIASLESGLSGDQVVERCMPLYIRSHPDRASQPGFKKWVAGRVKAQIYWAKKNVLNGSSY